MQEHGQRCHVALWWDLTQSCHESDREGVRWRPCPRCASPPCPMPTQPEPDYRPTLLAWAAGSAARVCASLEKDLKRAPSVALR